MTKKIPITTCLPSNIADKLRELKRLKQIDSVSGEIRKLVEDKFNKIILDKKNQKKITDGFNDK